MYEQRGWYSPQDRGGREGQRTPRCPPEHPPNSRDRPLTPEVVAMSVGEWWARQRPRRTARYNGVRVQLPWLVDRVGDRHTHEAAMVDLITVACEPGDHVVEVGGGTGCTAVHAARTVGVDGRITVFEGATKWAEACRRALADPRNGVEASSRVRETVVAEAVDVWGQAAADCTEPSNLPACDVLVLDAEGAEVGILSGYMGAGARPRAIVAEAHPGKGAPCESVTAACQTHGYQLAASESERADAGTTVLRFKRGGTDGN